MGFRPSFISWVKLLYTDVYCTVFINGYTSRSFKPSRGVRQGCTLSTLLYVLTMEVPGVNIQANPVIKGLCLLGMVSPLTVLSLYADVTSVISTSNASTVAIFRPMNFLRKALTLSLILKM